MNTPPDWQPSATREVLALRAVLLAQIRAFFAKRDVLEVETPVMMAAGSLDPALHSFATASRGGRGYYLQTSPEAAMKRLLAAGSGSIYQVSHVMRDGESGHRHNPEFTLLEWYRVDWDQHQLMDEVEQLVRMLLSDMLPDTGFRHHTYREVFAEHAGIDDVHAADVNEIREAAVRHGLRLEGDSNDRNVWLDLLMSHVIEPQLGTGACFIYDYPADQAALAYIRPGSPALAERFELYIKGVELANGFHELADADEQKQRFEREQAIRKQSGLDAMPLDDKLLAALQHGLPECSGVALGFDRLVMLASGKKDIRDVMAFADESV
jgi:lysyl-tRNA synthetase class 2